MPLRIQHNIIRFEVPENYHIFVEGLKCQDKLGYIVPGLYLWD